MRWAHLKPAGIPEHRQVCLLNIATIGDATSSLDEHLSTFLQYCKSLSIERVADVDILCYLLVANNFRHVKL